MHQINMSSLYLCCFKIFTGLPKINKILPFGPYKCVHKQTTFSQAHRDRVILENQILALKIMFDGHIYLNYFKFDVLRILNKS